MYHPPTEKERFSGQRGGSRYRMGEGMLYLESTFGYPDTRIILSLPVEDVKNAHKLVEEWKGHPVLDVHITDDFFVVRVREVHIAITGKGVNPMGWNLTLTKE